MQIFLISNALQRYCLCLCALLLGSCALEPEPLVDFVVPAGSCWRTEGVVDTDQLDRIVAELHSLSTASGMVYGLYSGESMQPITRQALGFRSDAKQQLVSLDDHFWIGSISKSLVGYTALRLQDQSLLSIEDRLRDYIGDALLNSQQRIADVGYQTSRLPNFAGSRELQLEVTENPARQWDHQSLSAIARAMRGYTAKPGRWRYSNTNTVLLAEVIAKATGRSWQAVVDTELLRPLQLNHTGLSSAGQLPEPSPIGYRHIPPGAPFSYGRQRMAMHAWNPSWTGAAGSYYSNERELASLTRHIANGSGLSERSQQQLWRWQQTPIQNYRYGFQLWERGGAIIMQGDVHGYSAFSAYVPAADLTLAILVNLSNTAGGVAPATAIGERVLACLASPASH